MRPSDEERIDDPCKYMAQLAQRILPLAKWGFEESFRGGERLIYNSKLCRLKIVWGEWDYMHGYSISLYYGRLHAPNEASTMEWNGEKCECWHRSEPVLHFLDGHPPNMPRIEMYSHPLIDPFYEDPLRKKYPNQPEWLLHMEALIWQHYAPHLFEVFDLRHPELWEQYRSWLKTCYIAQGRKEEEDEKKGLIPYYRVC